MSVRRPLVTFFSLVLLALGLGGIPAAADSTPTGGANHVVIAQLTTDGATLVTVGTQVVPASGDTVTSANIATAVNAGCVGCHTTAVAVQILIVTGNPSYFAPGNVAGAANGGCDSCGAYAYARQHWIQVSGPATLSGAARQRVAQLRQEISDVASSILPSDAATDPCVPLPDLPPPTCPTRDDELTEQLNGLANELIQVITDDLQASGTATSTVLDRTSETAPAS